MDWTVNRCRSHVNPGKWQFVVEPMPDYRYIQSNDDRIKLENALSLTAGRGKT